MIRIRHSLKPSEELELGGSNAELSELRQSIYRFCKADEATMHIPADSEFDPSPYEHRLAGLRLHKTAGTIVISVAGGEVLISGRPDLLRLFADNLPYDAQYTSSIPYHVHFDRAGQEDIVSEVSLDIVLGLKR